ncbi:hypothetical protein Q7C_2258 [Methylophaga frappieri]|uniref:Uncharacterized protein n=1 Tax=Methylophaga frappieri (strain ATCC BAA-2434 / DSM 25690 / JAM7) TaxID=754477 RepID=I1YKF1_METFJ|nr:hypothetical protein Q7C_2258 [Methylophaga frappieri]
MSDDYAERVAADHRHDRQDSDYQMVLDLSRPVAWSSMPEQ